MAYPGLLAVAIALAMDAFAASLCKGLAVNPLRLKHCLLCGGYFGFFQALMPLMGCLLGERFQRYIAPVDHWIVFGLLGLIGLNMLRESLEKEAPADASFSARSLLPLALATSIDALAAGLSLSLLNTNVLQTVLLIGGVTFLLSIAGVILGHLFGSALRSKAEALGGFLLIILGVKTLLEHLGIPGCS